MTSTLSAHGEKLLYEVSTGIATLTLNRPDKLNAFTQAMIDRWVWALQSLRLDLRTHLDLVSSHIAVVRETEDHQEGVRAFKDKRPPDFRGH